jgi:hypothetical protein
MNFKTKNKSIFLPEHDYGILSFLFICSKKPPCRRIAILQIATIPHPSIIQCTNWSHIPTRCHEEQKSNKDKLANSSSKTRET